MSIPAAIRAGAAALRRRLTRAPAQATARADAAAARGDWQEAIAGYLEADRPQPLGPAGLGQLVALLARHEDADAAAPYALRLLADRPTNRRALRVLSRAREPLPEAIEGWRKLALTDPTDLEPPLQLARLEMRRGDFEAARGAAETLLAIDPRHVEGLGLRESALNASLGETSAVDAWLAGQRGEPRRAALAREAIAEGDLDTAIALLSVRAGRGTAELETQRTALRARLAVEAFAAEVRRDVAEAATAFWRLKEIAPDDADFADGLSRSLDRLMQAPTRGGASSDSAAILALAEGRLEQAARLAKAGRAGTAIVAWLEIQPMVRRLAGLGETSEAVLSEVREAAFSALATLQSDGDLPGAWEMAEAITRLPDAGDIDHEIPRLMEATRAAIVSGESLEAAQVADLGRRFLDRSMDDSVARRLAVALIEMDRPGEALPVWQDLAAANPDSVDAWLKVADCARRLHRRDLGLAAAQHVIDLQPVHEDAVALRDYFRGEPQMNGAG